MQHKIMRLTYDVTDSLPHCLCWWLFNGYQWSKILHYYQWCISSKTKTSVSEMKEEVKDIDTIPETLEK